MAATDGDAAAESRLAAIIRSSADAIIMMTPGGVITGWNPSAARLYGYSAGDAVGLQMSALTTPERSRAETAIVERVARGARMDRWETERIRKDGRRIDVSFSLSPIRAPDQGIVALASIERDITDVRQTQDALLEALAHFESAFKEAPIGMALVSIEPNRLGRLLHVNQALCALTGRSSRDLRTTDFRSLTYPDDREVESVRLAQLIAGEIERYEIEKRLIHAHGHVLWVLSTVSLVRHPSRAPLQCILQLQDIGERKRFEGHLEHLADHDALTGLANRRRFGRDLGRQLSFAQRYRGRGAVLLLDIDNFKYVNDTLGHNAGDEIITAVAHLLRGRMRESDVLARIGGDEFAVLLPHADLADASAFARDMTAIVREAPISVGERRTRITVSVGIALFGADKNQTADDLMIDADLAVYDAKEAGRDLVVLSSQEHHARFAARLTEVERMRRALEQDLFVLHSQPILDLHTGGVRQHELLLRMPGQRGELLLPATFIYTAERSGLIRTIDRWVVGRAIKLISEQRRDGRELRLEVNISGRSVTDTELPNFIERELDAASVDPSDLIIELTETAAIANMDQARKFVARLHDIGCRFALDDFGAGFGSFYYLKHLPLDYLKIDGEFVRDLPASVTDQMILQAIVQMAQGLGKQTIAEFVVDEESIAFLREHGVDYAQGYHVGPPRPVSTMWPPVEDP